MGEDSLERCNVIVLFLINNDVWVCYKNNEIIYKNLERYSRFKEVPYSSSSSSERNRG